MTERENYINQTPDSFDERKRKAEYLKTKFPDKLPIIVSRSKKSDIVDIEKIYHIIPYHMTTSQFVMHIRKTIKYPPESELFISVNDETLIVPSECKMETLYQTYKSPDDYLRIIYSGNKPKESKDEIKEVSKEVSREVVDNIIEGVISELSEKKPEIKEPEISDEKLESNLKILSELKAGNRLWIADDTFSIDASWNLLWLNSIHRSWTSQSRNITIETIGKLINYTLANKSSDEKFMTLLKGTKTGLENLMVTYPDKTEEITNLLKLIS